MLLLTKFKDNTYCYTFEGYIYGPYSKSETIAIGKWMFKMSKYQLETGFKFFEMDYDIVTYKNLQFDSVRKIDYTEFQKERNS